MKNKPTLRILTILLLSSATTAEAAPWWLVHADENDTLYFIDGTSLTFDNGTAQYRAYAVAKNPEDHDGVKFVRGRYAIDCEKRTLDTLSHREYDEDNSLLNDMASNLFYRSSILTTPTHYPYWKFVCLDQKAWRDGDFLPTNRTPIEFALEYHNN